MTHTPTPYHVQDNWHPDIEGSVWIDSRTTEKPALAMSKANAAFIVRACNSHDQLVEALLGFIHLVEEDKILANDTGRADLIKTLGQTYDALAAARGEA